MTKIILGCKVILFVLILAGVGYCLKQLHLVYSADESFEYSEKLISEGDISRALTYANRAIKRNPLEPNYYRNRARVYLLSTVLQADQVVIENKMLATADMKRAYELNPQNLVTIRNLIPLYYFLAARDITQPPFPDNIDPKFVNVTQAFYSKIKNVSPNDVGVYALLAKYTNRLELLDLFDESVAKVTELREDLLEWYIEFPF